MAEALPTAAPPYAVKVWTDDRNVYAEVPSINSPCVVAFPISEGGLSKCLQLLGARHTIEGAGLPYIRPVHVAKGLLKEGLTQKDLDLAAAALRQSGILK